MPPYKKTKVTPVKEMSDEELEGPVTGRSCRDVPCCILFVLFIFGMVVVAGLAFQQGNPYSLIYGVDSWGNVCNMKNDNEDLTGLKRSFRFNAAFHFLSLVPGISNSSLAPYLQGDNIVVCVRQCPNDTLTTDAEAQAFQDNYNSNLCLYNVSNYVDTAGLCPKLPIPKQTAILNRCVPSQYIELITQSLNGFVSSIATATVGPDFAQNIVEDIQSTYKEILILTGIAFGSSLLLVLLMQCMAAILIWTIVFLIALGGLAAAGYCWYTFYTMSTAYQTLEELLKTPVLTEEVKMWLVYASCMTIISLIFIIILIFLRKRIGLCVRLFQEAGAAIRRIPMILFQPFWTLIILAGVVTLLVFIALYVETTGTPSLDLQTGFGVDYNKDVTWQVLRWYHYFGALWITAFIFACQDIIIAGAVATWYFNRTKRSLGWPLFASTWRLFRYHLGSVAFGSLIIAIIRFIRLMMAYIQRQLKGRTGKVAQFIMKAVQVCLYCFEKFIAFLNRNAYIEIAIYGHSFCTAAKKAFLLIVSNVLRLAVINSIGDFILFLGKIIPIGIVVVAGRELLKNRSDVNMIAAPIALVAAFAFAVAHCLFGVYGMVIDTIFICFCEDCEQNDGETKPYYMSKGLMKYMNASKKVELRRKKKAESKEDSKATSEKE